MKITIKTTALLNGLKSIAGVVTSRSTLPVLSHVLLSASEGRLTFTATDLDLGKSGSVDCEVLEDGGICIPLARLMPIVTKLPTADVAIETDSKHIATIKCGASVFKLMGLSVSEFPEVPASVGGIEFTFDQKALKDALKRVAHVASTDETRFVLNGVFVSMSDHKAMIVATDGRRLAAEQIAVPGVGDACDFIIPTKCVNELAKMLSETGEVSVSVSENQMMFVSGETRLVSKKIEGNYPNYRQVIPGEAKERVTLDREAFLGVVDRVALMASEKSESIKLAFTRDNIEITANTPDVGEGRESIAVNYKGAEFAIAFKPQFIADALRGLSEDDIYMDLIDERSPGVFRIKGSEYLHVVMPMRVS